MKTNPYQYEKSDMWAMLITALLKYVVGQTTKIYTTPKGDIRMLANATITSKRGDKFNKSFCYLLKNINEEDFFLICGKERLSNHNKQDIFDTIAQKKISSESIYDDVENEEGYTY